MDESLQELETELKALRPRGLSPDFVRRVQSDLAAAESAPADRPRYATATNLSSWKWLSWRTAGLAAALAVAAAVVATFPRVLRSAPAAPVASAVAPTPAGPGPQVGAVRDSFQPVAATNVLYDLQAEDLVNGSDQVPVRRVRARYVDTYTWRNPATHASLQWSVPRDEVRIIPASLH